MICLLIKVGRLLIPIPRPGGAGLLRKKRAKDANHLSLRHELKCGFAIHDLYHDVRDVATSCDEESERAGPKLAIYAPRRPGSRSAVDMSAGRFPTQIDFKWLTLPHG